LIYPTAIGIDPTDPDTEQHRQLDAWRTIQRAHAIANGMPLIACNRAGFEPDRSGQGRDAEFWGHSLIVGPQGELIDEAGSDTEVLIADLDLARGEQVRRIWPFLRDRRIDAYSDLLKRWRD